MHKRSSFAAAASCLTSIAATGTASAAEYFELQAPNGTCLEVAGASAAHGAPVVQAHCAGTANQQWRLMPNGTGYDGLVARHSGKCLDVTGGPLARAVQSVCFGGPDQQWQLQGAPNGFSRLVAHHGGAAPVLEQPLKVIPVERVERARQRRVASSRLRDWPTRPRPAITLARAWTIACTATSDALAA